MHRSLHCRARRWAAGLSGALTLAVLTACAASFQAAQYPTNEALYQASLAQFENRKWDNAVAGFERLTLQLPPRDTLLPRSHYYLGLAHERRGEELLAAQSFVRLVESFPGDTLADDALYRAAAAYQDLWRKPALDPQYGELAIETFRTLVAAYPQSSLVPEAERAIAQLREWMAEKDFETGRYYHRRRAYDSAIIYYQDVVAAYPETNAARQSLFNMLEIYRRLRYSEEAEQICTQLRTQYPGNAEVVEACGAAPATPPPVPADTGRTVDVGGGLEAVAGAGAGGAAPVSAAR